MNSLKARKPKSFIISIDIGTSFIKAGLYDNSGNCIEIIQEKIPQKYIDNGALEQHGDDFVRILLETLKSLMEKTDACSKSVKVIAFTGQMAGAIGVDKEWNAVTIWSGTMDTRQNLIMEGQIDNENILLQSGTNLPFMAKKIKWFEKEYARTISKVVKYVGLSSYVIGKITGIKVEDAFLGSTYLTWTGLADIENRKWSEELCSMFNIDIKRLPHIVDSTAIVGRLSKSVASLCGLLEGIPVVAGAGDKIAGCIGAGAVEAGIMVDECASLSAISLCTDYYKPDIKNKTLETLPSAIPGQYFSLFFISGSGLVIDWFIDNFAQEEKKSAAANGTTAYKILDEKSEKITPGSDNLLCIGLLSGRALPFDPNIRGMWIGHSLIHSKAHFYRSLLESYAYEYKHCLDIMKETSGALPFSRVRVIGGGGASSNLWNKIKTNVLAIPYDQLEREDCVLLGTAIIGGTGIGMFNDIADTARKFISIKNAYEVENKIAEKYSNLAVLYSQTIEKNKEIFEKLTFRG